MRASIKCLLVYFLCSSSIQGQLVNQNFLFNYKKEKDLYLSKNKAHTAFKSTNWIDVQNDTAFYFGIAPAFESVFGLQNEGSVARNGIGIVLNSSFRKWTAEITYLYSYGQYMEYQKDFIAERRVVPSMNVSRGTSNIQADYIQGYLNYEVNNVFNFQLGYGRNFIGDGYRSMFLSDFSNASPYLRIDAKLWKFKYTILYNAHQNIFNVEGNAGLYQLKYTVTHFLDWRISKWLTIGLFESIVWQAEEDGYRRGFEVNYLNPVIFFRPVEFSIGSSDNALVGANLKTTISKKNILYGQILFDEFLLSEIRADINQWRNPDQDIPSGWWGNKYSFQVGWKGFDLFSVDGLSSRLEFNSVRPYTYAHSNPVQAYSNYNLSLAHPLGANFHELLSITNLQHKRFNFQFQYNQSKRGISPLGTNFGENLELSNASREKDYENYLTQGVPVQVRLIYPSISYLLKKEWNAVASLGFIWREERQNAVVKQNNMLYLTIKTQLFNQYFDF